ncbi:acyl-CoA dehydrogenase [Antricoccus suffuscus]|uniref:Acyl-CoA dehydrogenase n=2 Tax=Antricoccus suffuscus TaxID=1629062 RepID=A0A2T0ZZF4_9ACTN|nr:acyl-CoA dehydrogenase [Antricoccus suffuscus]
MQVHYQVMSWDFETDAEYQKLLDWADEFVRTKVEPMDYVYKNPYDKSDKEAVAALKPLQKEVKDKGLWACHLGPDLGGPGYGQVKLALLNEILGRSSWAPIVFGCQAPDSGNAEILAHYATEEQKKRYLQPLLDGDIHSCYSMTEPQAGADPALFETKAVRDGDGWVLSGEKWFSSNAPYSEFFIVMAVTDTEKSTYHGQSMFIVPKETPGVEIIRSTGAGPDTSHQSHSYIRYNDVRLPFDALLGEEGGAFAIAQTRLGGGRIHHAMRTIAQCRKAFDLMCERALSRRTRNGKLADLQMTQQKIADSWIEFEQFRLLVLRTAWKIDKYQDYMKVRKDIAGVKVAMAKVYHDIVQRSMQLHGALGISGEMPFSSMMIGAQVMGIADGPTEVHQVTVAKQVLRDYEAGDERWPSAHIPTRTAEARKLLGVDK